MCVVLGKVLVCLRLRIMLLYDVLGEVFVGEVEGKMFELLVMFFLIILMDLSKSSHCHNQDTEYNLKNEVCVMLVKHQKKVKCDKFSVDKYDLYIQVFMLLNYKYNVFYFVEFYTFCLIFCNSGTR